MKAVHRKTVSYVRWPSVKRKPATVPLPAPLTLLTDEGLADVGRATSSAIQGATRHGRLSGLLRTFRPFQPSQPA